MLMNFKKIRGKYLGAQKNQKNGKDLIIPPHWSKSLKKIYKSDDVDLIVLI